MAEYSNFLFSDINVSKVALRTGREDDDTESDGEVDDIEEVDLIEVTENEPNSKVPYHPVEDEFLFFDDTLPNEVR